METAKKVLQRSTSFSALTLLSHLSLLTALITALTALSALSAAGRLSCSSQKNKREEEDGLSPLLPPLLLWQREQDCGAGAATDRSSLARSLCDITPGLALLKKVRRQSCSLLFRHFTNFLTKLYRFHGRKVQTETTIFNKFIFLFTAENVL
jgi:hypothetical protein